MRCFSFVQYSMMVSSPGRGCSTGFQVHGAVELVVEEVNDGSPDRVGGGIRGAHDLEDVTRDSVVGLVDMALVDHHPFGIGGLRGRQWHGEVRTKSELADVKVQEAPQLGVFGLCEIEGNGDMRLHVDSLECGSSGRARRRGVLARGTIRLASDQGGSIVDGGLKIEERVEIHMNGSGRKIWKRSSTEGRN